MMGVAHNYSLQKITLYALCLYLIYKMLYALYNCLYEFSFSLYSDAAVRKLEAESWALLKKRSCLYYIAFLYYHAFHETI